MATEQMSGVNPDVLKWAREFLGYDLDNAAKNITTPQRLGLMERGELAPTYHQLLKLADKYMRPAALFFFPDPPDETPPKTKFRTLPDFKLDQLPPQVLKKIQIATLRQESLRDLTNGVNPARRQIINDIKIDTTENVRLAAKQVRAYLGINVNTQAKWSTSREALKAWRDAIEKVGIFVFKDAFRVNEVDGFCLYDPIYPIIVLNNSRAHTRQTFTLMHELAHLLLQNSGVTLPNTDYIDALSPADRAIEIFCNRFAAEFLMPSDEFSSYYRSLSGNLFEKILDCSLHFNVSSKACLFRAANLRLADQTNIQSALSLITKQEEEALERKRLAKELNKQQGKIAGDHYNNVMHYLGDRFIDLVFGEYYKGNADLYQVADHLGESPKNVAEIESRYLARA